MIRKGRKPDDSWLPIYRLRVLAGWTQIEIAESLNISLVALRRRINRARHKGDSRAIYSAVGEQKRRLMQ